MGNGQYPPILNEVFRFLQTEKRLKLILIKLEEFHPSEIFDAKANKFFEQLQNNERLRLFLNPKTSIIKNSIDLSIELSGNLKTLVNSRKNLNSFSEYDLKAIFQVSNLLRDITYELLQIDRLPQQTFESLNSIFEYTKKLSAQCSIWEKMKKLPANPPEVNLIKASFKQLIEKLRSWAEKRILLSDIFIKPIGLHFFRPK